LTCQKTDPEKLKAVLLGWGEGRSTAFFVEDADPGEGIPLPQKN